MQVLQFVVDGIIVHMALFAYQECWDIHVQPSLTNPVEIAGAAFGYFVFFLFLIMFGRFY